MYTHTGHTGLIRVILVSYVSYWSHTCHTGIIRVILVSYVSYWSHTCHTGIIHVMLVSIYVLYCSYIHVVYLLQMQERGEDRKLLL